ncbi:hypothetical protein BBJ28_00021108 [Nothophytophthora sp. Chile5]|nr:hypothetical protein BBJ28_00021108 [Nothophytophthora sp. Chile5]
MPGGQFETDAVAMLSWHEPAPLMDPETHAPLFARRKASLPTSSSSSTSSHSERPRGVSAPGSAVPPLPSCLSIGGAPRRRGFTLTRHQSAPAMAAAQAAGKPRRRRKVTFKNAFAPVEVVPPPKVESYDELVFNVAGLFHTMSFLHDPMEWGDDPTTHGSMSSSSSSSGEEFDPEPPMERSVPLMIAEFLYRSAVYVGYPTGETPWLPGFREDKRFSGNDVKRWRRLAHFDWESEEREFQALHCSQTPPSPQPLDASSGSSSADSVDAHSSMFGGFGTSFRLRRQDSTSSLFSSSKRSQDGGGYSRGRLRSAVSEWIHRHRRHDTADEAVDRADGEADERTRRHAAAAKRQKQVSWLNPPPVAPGKDLELLVSIVNSCVYCGPFQFKKRDVVMLCNVVI